ncbi:MAG: cupin fold metalloprotein, WbuC family [Magnetococcales bacterium]|nr:cupin fold metalloprotein, WbuC family [Magnetococcales bacterium]
MPSVIFSPQPFPLLDRKTLDLLKKEALTAELGRSRACIHRDHEDPVQEMVIVHSRRSLDRPHRHEGKSLSILVLEGVLRVPHFDAEGRVIRCFEMGTPASGLPFLTRFSLGEWYACVPMTDPVVIFEAMSGPFDKGGGFYPDWAPEGGDDLAAFLRRAAARVC